MWILINWSNDDGSDILPVNSKEGADDTKKFKTEEDALRWAVKNLNLRYRAIEI